MPERAIRLGRPGSIEKLPNTDRAAAIRPDQETPGQLRAAGEGLVFRGLTDRVEQRLRLLAGVHPSVPERRVRDRGGEILEHQ